MLPFGINELPHFQGGRSIPAIRKVELNKLSTTFAFWRKMPKKQSASMRLFSSHKIGTKTVRRGTASQPVLTRYKLLSIERLSSLLQTRTRLNRVECAYADE